MLKIPSKNDFVLFFDREKLYLDKNQGLPCYTDMEILTEVLTDQTKWMLKIGKWEGKDCFLYLGKVAEKVSGFVSVSIRSLLNNANGEFQSLLHRANHIIHWHRGTFFCGRCGEKLQFLTNELGKKCRICETNVYPRINPCIIVAITRKDRILLAEISRNNRSFSSVLAGYVEIGESLEQCVAREVKEEVGIEIKNIQYFASQAWSFSQSLMVAFIAEYESGEIQVDGVEIQQAAWYQKKNLPDLPPHYSIARELIEWFKKQ